MDFIEAVILKNQAENLKKKIEKKINPFSRK